MAAYNADSDRAAYKWVTIGSHTLPNWRIGEFFDSEAVTADKLIATYSNAAAYLADAGRANRLFAVIGGSVYSVRVLEAANNNRALTDSNLPAVVEAPETTTALGDNAKATGDSTTAVGGAAEATGTAAVAVGNFARAPGNRTVAIGEWSRAYNDRSIAIGDFSAASALESTAVGVSATGFGRQATALGHGATAVGDWNTALGHSAAAANWGADNRWEASRLVRCAQEPGYVTNGQWFVDECSRHLTQAEREHANLVPNDNDGQAYRRAIQTRLRQRIESWAVQNATAVGHFAQATGNSAAAVGANSAAGGSLPEYENFGAYLEAANRPSGWVRVNDRVYPAWEIDAFFGFGARDFAAADIMAEYADAAAYLADGERANRPFAVVGGVLYRTQALEAARASGRLGRGELPNPVWQAPGGYKTTALGADARATGIFATALGGDARAAAVGSLAVGAGAGFGGIGEWSTAVGPWAEAPGESAAALGNSAGAYGESSTAVGSVANAAGEHGTAVGSAAQTGAAADATAIGEAAVAFGAGTVALGRAAVAGAEVHDIVPQNGRLWELVQCAEDAGRYAGRATDFEDECIEYLTAEEQANADMFAATEAGETARRAVQARLKTSLGGLSADRATAVGAYAHASGAGSIALGRGAEAAGANAIAIGAGVAAAANEAVIGAAGHSYRLPGFAAEEGAARLLGVDSQGRLVAGAASFGPGAPELGVRVATLELGARSVGSRVGTLETTTKTIEDEVTGVSVRLGQGNQTPHEDGRGEGTAFQRIAALDADMGAPDDDGRRGEDASAFQRIAALDTIIDALDSEDEAAIIAKRAEQKVEEATQELAVSTDDDGYVQTGEGDGGNVQTIVAETDRGSTDRVETVKIRTGTGDDRVVVTLKGATNEQIMTLVALLSNSELSNRPVTGADGEPVGTTMEEFLELDKNKALAEADAADASEAQRAANAVSATERLAYLFQALYGKPYGDTGVADGATDSDAPDPRSIAGRAAIIELDDRKALRKLDDAGAIDEVVVQEIGPGGGRLRTLPMSRFDGAEALAQVNALTGRVDGVRRDLSDLSERVDGSAAMASALTALPNVVPGGGRVYVGAGAGNYRGEQALALGLSARLDRESNIFVNIGAAISTGGEVVSRIGAGVVW